MSTDTSAETNTGPAPELAVRNLCRLYGLRARINRRKREWRIYRVSDGKNVGWTSFDRTIESWINCCAAYARREGKT